MTMTMPPAAPATGLPPVSTGREPTGPTDFVQAHWWVQVFDLDTGAWAAEPIAAGTAEVRAWEPALEGLLNLVCARVEKGRADVLVSVGVVSADPAREPLAAYRVIRADEIGYSR